MKAGVQISEKLIPPNTFKHGKEFIAKNLWGKRRNCFYFSLYLIVVCFLLSWRDSDIRGRLPLKKIEVILSASADHITSNFLKAVFRKFYLVHS